MPKTVAIVPAAGAGVRMGGDRAKQYLHLEDRPILAVTLEALQQCPMLDAIVLVVHILIFYTASVMIFSKQEILD